MLTPTLLIASSLLGPAGPGALTPEEAGRWAVRLERLAGPGWTVAVRGDDVVLTRTRPVHYVDFPINAPAAAGPSPTREGACRVTLRFSGRIGIDEYDRIVAANARAVAERDRLARGLDLPHKFGEFVAATPAEKARLEAFRAEEAKDPTRDLPDLYTPDRSITVFRSWGPFSGLDDDGPGREVRELMAGLTRLFGVYSGEVVAGRDEVGRPEGPDRD